MMVKIVEFWVIFDKVIIGYKFVDLKFVISCILIVLVIWWRLVIIKGVYRNLNIVLNN